MIPKLNISNALSVYDGAEIAGFVVRHERSFFSYDRDYVLLGEYRSQAEAMKAIPKVPRVQTKEDNMKMRSKPCATVLAQSNRGQRP